MRWPDALRVVPRLWLLGAVTPDAARVAREVWVARASATEAEALVRRLCGLEGVALRGITLRAELKSARLDALLKAPCTAGLERLSMAEEARLTARSCGALAELHAARLTTLKLFPWVSDEVLAPLSRASWPALRVLALPGHSEIDGAAVARWVEQAPLLEELDLTWRRCTAAIIALAALPLPRLRRLRLDSAWLEVEGLDALERAPWLAQLDGLHVRPYHRPSVWDEAHLPRLMALHERLRERARQEDL
jgi:hypothetical protein